MREETMVKVFAWGCATMMAMFWLAVAVVVLAVVFGLIGAALHFAEWAWKGL